MLEELQQTLCPLPEEVKDFVVLELDQTIFCPIAQNKQVEIITDPELTFNDLIYEIDKNYDVINYIYTTKFHMRN
jgi:hypothetical protein